MLKLNTQGSGGEEESVNKEKKVIVLRPYEEPGSKLRYDPIVVIGNLPTKEEIERGAKVLQVIGEEEYGKDLSAEEKERLLKTDGISTEGLPNDAIVAYIAAPLRGGTTPRVAQGVPNKSNSNGSKMKSKQKDSKLPIETRNEGSTEDKEGLSLTPFTDLLQDNKKREEEGEGVMKEKSQTDEKNEESEKEEKEVVEIVEPEDESQVQVLKEQAASSSQVQEVHEPTQLQEEDLQQDKDEVKGCPNWIVDETCPESPKAPETPNTYNRNMMKIAAEKRKVLTGAKISFVPKTSGQF